jgi:hypothetical protein
MTAKAGEEWEMGKVLICLAFAIVLISLAAADMYSTYYEAMGNIKNEEVLCVKNYQAGATITESYTDFESLEKETQVVSRTFKDRSQGNPVLEANINSNVVGHVRLGWESRNATADSKGRHAVVTRSLEEAVGAFTVQTFIQLWGNNTTGAVSLDWLPCG